MSEENQACDAGEFYRPSWSRRTWEGLRRWVFLHVWLAHCYRPVMKALHRFNLHYMAPRMIWDEDDRKYGRRHYHCDWCGLTGTKKIYERDSILKI